jgi:hypothetical protein
MMIKDLKMKGCVAEALPHRLRNEAEEYKRMTRTNIE